MTYTYNNKRHKQLVKRYLDLKNQGKSLSSENDQAFRELREYENTVAQQIYWAHREEFIKAIKNLLTKNIDFDKFEDTFLGIYWTTNRETKLFQRDLKQIEKFEPEPSAELEVFYIGVNCILRALETVENGFSSKQEVINSIKEICLRDKILKDEIDIWT